MTKEALFGIFLAYLARYSFTESPGTISSLKVYAPVLGDFTHFITLAHSLPEPAFLSVATTFFAILFDLFMNGHSL